MPVKPPVAVPRVGLPSLKADSVMMADVEKHIPVLPLPVKPAVAAPLAGSPLPKADTVKIQEVEKRLSNRLDVVEKMCKEVHDFTHAKCDGSDARAAKAEMDLRSYNTVVHKNHEDMSARVSRMEGLSETNHKCSKAFFRPCLVVS